MRSLSAGDLLVRAVEFDRELAAIKARVGAPDFWHPHGGVRDALASITAFLAPEHHDLTQFFGDEAVADLSGNDGDLAFFMESLGLHASIVDNAATNFNHLEGARRLKEARNSSVEIRDVDIDATPYLTGWYDFAFMLDRLFHFKNPYGALERLARRARHCVASTRIMRTLPEKHVSVHEYPLAYLLDESETSGDRSCYWVFTEPALRRLVSRAGWTVLDYGSAGNRTESDPISPDSDERAFLLMRSNLYG